MRLVCPKCHALYEVDDSAIPQVGRDVQCSNCGHTWFQTPSRGDTQPDETPSPDHPAEGGPASDATPDATPGAQPGAQTDAQTDAAADRPAMPGDTPSGAGQEADDSRPAPAAQAADDTGENTGENTGESADDLPGDALEALRRALADDEAERATDGDADANRGEGGSDRQEAGQTPPRARDSATAADKATDKAPDDTDSDTGAGAAASGATKGTSPGGAAAARVDPSVFEILKREAAREKALRARDAHSAEGGAEADPDMGDTRRPAPQSGTQQGGHETPLPPISGERDFARQADSFREKLTRTRQQAIEAGQNAQATQGPSAPAEPAPDATEPTPTPPDPDGTISPPEWPERVAPSTGPGPARDTDRHTDPGTAHGKGRAPAGKPRRNRLGFLTAILIFLILLGLYLFRVRLSDAFPGAAPWLDSYGAIVDRLRLVLATAAGALLAAVRGLLSNLL